MLQYTIEAQHMDMTAPMQAYAEKKLVQSVERIFKSDAVKLDIKLVSARKLKHGARMECRVHMLMPMAGGHRDNVIVREVDGKLNEAIDKAQDRLVRQARRHRDRHRDGPHRRKNAAAERALVARQELTREREPWEAEMNAYLSSRALS